MTLKSRGFITILTGLYSFQDCIHFLASVRKFHQEPIIVLIDRVPKILYPLLTIFKNVILKPAPANENTVLASRLAKLALYEASNEFEKTIYLDADICLLSDINDVFEYLDEYDFLLTEDVQPSIAKATNLVRGKQEDTLPNVLSILQSVGLPLQEDSIQYNGGFMAFKKTESTKVFFEKFKDYFEIVRSNQDKLLLKDQGAFASAIATVKPSIKILSPTYNYLSKWKDCYQKNDEPIKVLHCTYPYRPQYAKDITSSIYTKVIDKLAKVILPNQIKNPWRKK
ncbi:glycosyltransferase [Chlorogloeopsis sp. ULAP01]|uniref:glycosyltransferase n=1 Tax=Chlorogloeopsis sp. ULAP01 TaxID=3056483 RepID=UPI0025AB1C4A|nr:glycosyltransferase [Chlorogloeopsis sp. ULAP01]MDM9379259.1 glycosyltransferase [Chlorogloeopsis sp. ULAP01]